jgi:peptidoglycan/LPS O-acetylase OafA/YrhL
MKPGKDFEIRHLAYIDSLRGIAFLLVLCTHAAGCVGAFAGDWVFASGVFGVELFFLASAITLCYSSSKRSGHDRYPWLAFALRRFFRIAPLFWLAMIFYWTVPHTWPEFMHQTGPDSPIRPFHFFLTATFLHGWRPDTLNSIVPGGWSIAVEMTFYLIFPLCFTYLNSMKRAVFAVIVSLLVARLGMLALQSYLLNYLWHDTDRDDFFVTHYFISQLPTFLIGIAAFHFLRSGPGIQLTKSPAMSRMLFALCVFAYPGQLNGDHNIIPRHLTIVFLLAGMIVAISSNSITGLVNPIFGYIGKISYSCYLVHFACLVEVLKLFGFGIETHVHDAGSSLHNLINFAKIWCATLALTVIAATITFHCIEQPGIALGRWIIRRINSQGTAPSSAAPALAESGSAR